MLHMLVVVFRSAVVAILFCEVVLAATELARQANAGWALHRISTGPISHSIDFANKPNFTYVYDVTAMGVGVTAFVVGDGVQCRHKDFGDRAICSRLFDFVDGPSDADWRDIDRLHAVEPSGPDSTALAGVLAGSVYGVCKKCIIFSIKVNDILERTQATTLLYALATMREEADMLSRLAAVIVIPDLPETAGALTIAIGRMIGDGFHLVVSAPPQTSTSHPCKSHNEMSLAGIIVTGGMDSLDRVATGITAEDCISLFAPSVAVNTVYWDRHSPEIVNSAAAATAPYLAAGYVAGTLASWLSIDRWSIQSPEMMKKLLINHADHNVLSGVPPGTPNSVLRSLPP
ncbi:hypothetical protein PYCC9005_001139 [Savitreella phatthalungensis]